MTASCTGTSERASQPSHTPFGHTAAAFLIPSNQWVRSCLLRLFSWDFSTANFSSIDANFFKMILSQDHLSGTHFRRTFSSSQVTIRLLQPKQRRTPEFDRLGKMHN